MDNFGDFELLKILREIPFRRRVYLAKKEKSHFILKIFSLKKEYLRELKGALILNESDVLTPKILSFGEKETEYYIVFEYINNAINLEDYLKSNKVKIRSIFDSIQCNGVNLLEFAATSNALDVGEYLIGKLPVKTVTENLASIKASSAHLAKVANERIK